jgi:CRISPR system Cascade subunit CasE
MYLSKAILKWPNCRNPYQWHRIIWHLFPDRQDDKRDYQFACLRSRTDKDIPILILSRAKPQRIQTSEIELIDESKSMTEISFKPGQTLSFRLTANPAKKLTEETIEKRKIRIPFIKQEEQIQWLKRKLDGMADIVTVISQNEPPLYFNRNGKAGKIVPVTFEGTLKVIEPEKFKEQIYEKYDQNKKYIAGIGPAKAFGCGLMLVKRA